VGFLLLYTIVSVVGRPGFALTAFSDITGTALCLVATAMMLWAALSNQGRTRWFWILLATGAGMVGCNFGAWLYYEVIRSPGPARPVLGGHPALFCNPVPMMAAAAMRPGSRQREQKFHLTTLNFLILLLWWVCVYMFLVYPNGIHSAE